MGIPHRGAEGGAVKDARLRPVDDHAPPADLSDDLVQWALADEELLGHVAEAVEGRARQREQVALELAARGDVAAVDARQVVRGQQQAHAADADEDTQHLCPVIAHAQEEERDGHDDDDGPEVDQLRRQDGGIAVGEHGEVVAFHVAERQDDVCGALVGWVLWLGRIVL